MIKDYILEFYRESSKYDETKKYTKLKIYLLYPATIMNESLLNIFTGIVTGLSMNIFTNVISFQEGTLLDFLMWIFRFLFAIFFNVCSIKFSIICTLLREKIVENQAIPHIERIVDYKDRLLDEYNSVYEKLRHEAIVGMISVVAIFILVVIYPIVEFILSQLGSMGSLLQSVDVNSVVSQISGNN